MNSKADILIVDDIPEHIAFAGAILKNEGYKVYAVTDGLSALEFLKSRRPDLIMLDIRMEGMDGLELCRKIKSDSETADIPVIFLTAETSRDVIRQGFECGGCDYVVKPFIPEEYLARVKTHLDISRKAQALAASNNELRLFCSAVSHDLKSPLNVINMLIDALKNELGENQNENVTKITDMISDKSTKLIVMIERLLNFSKMCNITPEFETLDMEYIINSVFNEQLSSEPQRNISLIMGELPPITGDAVLIEMLVKNVISNAFKFTAPRRNAVITVASIPNDEYNIISIKDNGVGFDMAYSDKLFKIFQRLHMAEEFDGSGVGLALVDRIMRRHGGKVEAYGKVNKGAEFRLFFLKS